MRTRLVLLILLILPTTVFAVEETPPRFQTVSAFLTWADDKLAVDDYDALVKAQAENKEWQETKLANLKKLDADLGTAKLAKVFEDRQFPTDASTFKLGGHAKELGHCHIDFIKKEGAWHVARIWHCR